MNGDVDESEFGMGFTYCIALFLMLNAAADHLYEMNVPEDLPHELVVDMKEWSDKCIAQRLAPGTTKEDAEWAISEAKRFLMEIDKHMGAKVKEACWS